ncbi:prepilin-type N-terminal cleavage/methylation domain-containing protein [bacterium]|nr:prepilin-type N-terminal cleavage/methylation domain-containing protein [bacterium]
MNIQTSHPKSTGLRGQGGFTLIELLVVSMIISILAAFSTITVMQNLPKMRLRSTISEMKNHINMFRSLSIKRNIPIIAEIDTVSRSISFYYDENKNCIVGDTIDVSVINPVDYSTSTVSVSDEYIRRYNLPQSVSFGFGPPYDAPPSNSVDNTTSISSSDIIYYKGTNEHEVDGKFVLVFGTNGRFQDINKELSYLVIFICHEAGKYGAIEILASGSLTAYQYNSNGDGKWNQL